MLPALAALLALGAPVTFRVEVPHCTPPGQQVYLRSNRMAAGTYQHDALTRTDATHYEGTFEVATDRATFRYKYSAGTCEGARCPGIEKALTFTGNGGEVADRELAAGVTETDDFVFVWRSALALFDAQGAQAGLRATGQKVAFCGPYLSVSSEGGDVTLGVDSYDASDVVLEHGPTSSYGTRLTSSGKHRNHFRLTNLPRGAEVHYRITTGGVTGPDRVFRAPPPADGTFKLGFIGDSQVYNENDRRNGERVVAELLRFGPDLVLSPGDLVASEQDAGGRWIKPEMGRFNVLFGIVAPLMERAPFMTAMGNHEEDVDYYWDVFDFPKPDAPKLDHYWFKYGSAHITALYTGVTDGYDYNAILDSQTAWLDETLAAAEMDPEVKWKIVFLHRGPFSQGANHPTDGMAFWSGGTAARSSWGAIFERRGVDLVLAGHNHNLTVAKNNGVRFVTSCGGAPVHDLRPQWEPTTIYAERTCTADRMVVSPRTLAFSAVRPDGTPVPEAAFTMCHDASDCGTLANPCPGAVSWSCADKVCNFSCTSAPAPSLVAAPDRVVVAAVQGAVRTATISVTASDGSNVPFTASVSGAPWLTAAPASATTPAAISLRADARALAAGDHAASVVIRSPASSATVAIALTVRTPTAAPVNLAPSAPVALVPADGAALSATPSLEIANAVDPEGDALLYTFEVDGAAIGDPITEGLGGRTSAKPAAVLAPGSHTWRARATDAKGAAGPWSTSRGFTIGEIGRDAGPGGAPPPAPEEGGCACAAAGSPVAPGGRRAFPIAAGVLLAAMAFRAAGRRRGDRSLRELRRRTDARPTPPSV